MHAEPTPTEQSVDTARILLQKVQELLTHPADELKTVLIREMLEGVLKLYEMPIELLDIKILNRAFKELRYAFRVFHPYHAIPKVSIFGSARTSPDDPTFQLAVRFAHLLSQRGFMVITGAGEGIMWAGHQGAGKERSFGVNIMLPFEQVPNPTIANDPKLVNLKYFFTRKLLFVRESHATALFPGGFGTLDEAFEVLTLVQTGKANPVPIVCLQAPESDYWDRWYEFLKKELVGRRFIAESDLALFKIFTHEEPAVQEIQTFYRNYHSIRFVNDELVVRIKHPLTSGQLAQLHRTFSDLLARGTFVQRGPLPEELDEPALAELPRVVFHYHRRDAGRLRQFIDWLNAQSSEQDTNSTTSCVDVEN
ncbi:MAG: LOG family protein [Nitrospirae bacterium]|nr:MAG: LOG family protein [Nitrospirota bacterium]